ncbi:hypothetical protein [Pyxidicoccus sp. MSG2]|uniref:hypothetical protein n=1 Tax=Pyxidicoccus sp. MSG2 TaxID=2996790 RepID=UPI00226E80EE|nr:hypothetical protein [Pyxidicoccus sp. MSG2]MCY1020132.1 hypothetical protein [Pyxidicoccus sp. MSG2]
MFSKLTRQLSTLLLVGAASLALGGCSAAPAGSDDTDRSVAVASQSLEMTEAGSEQSLAACSPSCHGPCWTCIRSVCENTCQ